MKIKRTAKIEENSDGALQEIISTIPGKVLISNIYIMYVII